MFRRKFLIIAAFVSALSIPGMAMAASVPAITTAGLNIRVGPGAGYARFATIPYGDNVSVNGCISGYNWCDVSWAGTRGWVSGSYLAYLGERYYRRSLPSVAVAIGLPVIGYDYNDYYDRYYIGRHFRGYHFDRHHRRAIRREHRQEVRQDRRERRQEVRQNRRERRQEIRQERRERRHEVRQERRHDRRQKAHDNRNHRRHEARQERRQDKRERRQERRERRAD